MKNFLTLVSVENTKLWKRISSKVMIIILAVIIIAATSIIKYYNSKNDTSSNNKTQVSQNWKEDLQKDTDALKAQLTENEKNGNKLTKITVGSTKKTIAENEYRIKNDVNPNDAKGIWTRITEFDTQAGMSSLIALFLIITCAAVVAGEFSEGTMKMMITRPYKRHEILTAKLGATLLYGLELIGVTIVLNFVFLGIFYGFNGLGAKEMLWTGSKILFVPAILKMLIIFALDFLQVLFYVIVAFVISAMFRSRSMATGFSLFLLLVGGGIIRMLAVAFGWCKFLPFATADFSSYLSNGTYIPGTSLGFALIVSGLYTILFCVLGYYTFQKRDI
jgi:ABC-2 type transport system permease protein